MELGFVIIAIVICLLVLLVWKLGQKKKLSASTIIKYSAKIRKTSTLNPAHAVMESHKIFVSALSELFSNKNLTAAQKIAKIQKRLPNPAKIWQHHNLRNKIAHETDVEVTKRQAEKARYDFIKALEKLGK